MIQFLKGLNSESEGRRATMFHQPTLPTLEEAIAAVAQEEVGLKVMKNNVITPSRRAYIATRNNETRDCFNCGEPGHLSRDCHAPRKANRGRARKMTEVEQEEVEVGDIELATKRIWHSKKRDY